MKRPIWEQRLRDSGYSATVAETRDLFDELDRLRALPVIATCGECGHAPSRHARRRVCQNPSLFDREDPVLLTVEHADTPPAGCPLRGTQP